MTAYHYPRDLAARCEADWPADLPCDPLASYRGQLFEVAYQASLARDEERPVRLRLVLARLPELLLGAAAESLHVLPFDRPRSLDVDELRRLAAAAPFETALICVAPLGGTLRIFGIAWSGAQWLAPTWGGRGRGRWEIPRTVVHVSAPGRLAVYAGDRFVAALERGGIVTLATDVFQSAWMPALFAGVRDELIAAHERRREPGMAALDDSLIRSISQHMIRRALWLMRASHHGGIILIVEPDEAEALLAGPLRAKYRFSPGEAQARYRMLLGRVTDHLTRSRGGTVSERDFLEASGDLAEVEAAIFELSRLIASLSAVDGAVLLTKRFELLAFGVEVVTGGTSSPRIRRALDAEGTEHADDHEESVGTRHRAAYRFVDAHPPGLAVVVSQDGTVRFVARRDGAITYFEQHLAG